MKKKITIGVGVALLALIIVLICIFAIMPDANLKNMLDMIDRQEAIVIEVPEPISEVQGTTIDYEWTELASLTTYPEFRTTFDDALNITAFGDRGKNGCIYVDLDGNQTNNSTLYNAFMNQKFVEDYYENTDVSKKIIEASKGIYSDIESDNACLLAGYNGYFNIIPDSEPGYANINSTMTRLEAMTAIFKASTPVQDIKKNEKFAEAVDNKQYAIYAQNMADYSYLDYTNESLDSVTANGTITRAEFIYMLVQDYYSDEYGKVTGKENSYSDAKNGGNIAEKAGFVTKDKKTGEVTAPNRWQAYELSYALQNESNGMPETLYKAMVVAKNHNLITGDESRWSDGLTKGEALNLIITVYEDLASTNGYKTNVDRGAATGEAVTDSTIIEDTGIQDTYDYNKLFPGFAKENITFNAGGVVIDYNEKFIAECKKYDTFRECSDDEIKEILKTVIEESMGKIERTPEEYHKTLSELDKNGVNAKDLLQLNEETSSSSSSQTSKPSSSNSNTNSNSNKGNTGSTNTSSTPSQDADLTKGYGDAGGSSTSEAPVQSVDDGFDCNESDFQWGDISELGEDTGATMGQWQ